MREEKVDSLEAMQKLAAKVAATLKGGDVVLLTGELGVGKTTFTQGIAKALGIKEPVTSPTFTIVSEYQIDDHESFRKLVHGDLYRLEDNTAATDAAVRDMLEQAHDPGRLTIIEWSEKLGSKSLTGATHIAFTHGATDNERTVTISNV
jgi:tRNA threonylcarbamoyladenosine biosynthesis protein TsaE